MPTTNFTEELNSLILRKNISHEQLNQEIGTNEVFLNRLLNGEVDLTLDMMSKIAKKLGCKIKIQFEDL